MTNEFLPFAKPSIDQATIDEVIDCLQSGWLTTGPRVQRFEAALRDYLQAPHALTITSATEGLQLALIAIGLQPGDEVITTPMTFVATLNAIVLAGGKPVLVDINPRNYNLDIHLIEAAITPKAKAILPVHFAGLVVDLDPIYELANHYNLRVIEDAAHAIGAEYKGKRIGSFGDIQVFSFHPNKNMTTGEGGCITTRDTELAERITQLRFHGINRKDSWQRFTKRGSQHYDVMYPGFKSNMMDLQAAIGIHQLAQLDQFIERRTALAHTYLNQLAVFPQLALPQLPNYTYKHAWHLFTPLINPEIAGFDRDQFMQRMKEHNIGTGYHFQAAHLFRYYQRQFGYRKGDFPHAEYVAERIVSLPLFPAMTDNDQARVLDAIHTILHA